MERCPCCNARLKTAVKCPRCQADLSSIISSEQSAQYWLSKAIQYWAGKEIEKSLAALKLSLQLKKTSLSIIFRDFIIQQQCQNILDLLAKHQLLAAKQLLYRTRLLIPISKQLKQLHIFTDYLLLKSSSQPNTPDSS